MARRLAVIPTTARGWGLIQDRNKDISVCQPAATALTRALRKAIKLGRKSERPDKVWERYVLPVHNRYGNKCATSDTMVREMSYEMFQQRVRR